MHRRFGMAVALSVAAVSSAAYGQSYTWTGGTSSWSNPASWSSGTVPGPLADIVIDNDTATNSRATAVAGDASSHSLNSLRVDAGDLFFVAGTTVTSATVNGRLTLTGGQNLTVDTLAGTGHISFSLNGATFDRPATSTGYLDVPAGLTVEGPFSTTSHPVYNHGILQAGYGLVSIAANPTAANVNAGVVVGYEGADLFLDNFVNNPGGTLSIMGDGINPGGTLTIGPGLTTPFQNLGTVHLEYGKAQIQHQNAGTPDLHNFELVSSSVDNASGAPLGLSSVLHSGTITGDAFTQPNSHVKLTLGGFGADPADDTPTDLLALTGTLDLSAADDYLELFPTPSPNHDTVPVNTVITAANIIGTFDHVTPGYAVTYTPTSVVVTALPEPAALSALALVGVPALRRRRRRRTGRP